MTMKVKSIIAAAALLLCAMPSLKAQTIDFTGVTINTERVKKTYDHQNMLLITGCYDISLEKADVDYNTVQLGVRYASLWKWGFYAGASIGVNGIPAKREYAGGYTYYKDSPKRNPRLTVTAGGMVRLGEVVSLYFGSGIGLTQALVKTEDAGWKQDVSVRLGPLADAGINLGFGPVCVLTGATYNFGEYQQILVNLGVGYRF